jgi:hypothetical protein
LGVCFPPSDASWRIVPESQKGWRQKTSPQPNWATARLVARLHEYPGFPNRPQVLFPSALQPPMIKFWQRGWFQITMLTVTALAAAFYFRLLARLAQSCGRWSRMFPSGTTRSSRCNCH